MIWRIFRLPGSRENWHIDAGCIHHAFNVRAWEIHVNSRAVDVGGNNVPRAWIEIRDADLHIINGVAVFDPQNYACPVKEIFDEVNDGGTK